MYCRYLPPAGNKWGRVNEHRFEAYHEADIDHYGVPGGRCCFQMSLTADRSKFFIANCWHLRSEGRVIYLMAESVIVVKNCMFDPGCQIFVVEVVSLCCRTFPPCNTQVAKVFGV